MNNIKYERFNNEEAKREKYIQTLKKIEKEEQKKKSPIKNIELWDEYPDFKKEFLINSCHALAKHLVDSLNMSLKGIDVISVKLGECIEPKFVVLLPNEYRGDEELLSTLPKTWGGRLEVEYRNS